MLVIPLYLMLAATGLAETFWGLVIPFALGSPYAVFLLRQQFLSVPRELTDAAELDRLGPFGILIRIVAPLHRASIGAVVLITVATQWNSFLWPRVIAGTQWQVLTVATSSLQSRFHTDWTLVMAATSISIVPMAVLLFVFQRQLTRAIVRTAY